ncbi:uncharacterized protein [Neodiprion pinetum]|uniref:uncharacterized protein isoform X1 n=1 Tax=Neodiprion pinetum TaxID=441929 RepID=UPI001EDCFF49|nr:uncharacterized protein LOC124219067 isoform X1 [Neodiprion pinetum]
MVNDEPPICQAKATHCMRMPLRSTEQIYLVFLIPTLINCTIYLVHFSADLVVVEQHFRESNPIWGSCTLAIMYAPAIAYFVLTVSRPDWWMSEDEKISKGVITWFILQICQLFMFPLFALYRYAGMIVLAVDAIMLSGVERTRTLTIAAKPAAIELYFFLQAWFQAAPQSIFQTHLLFRQQSVLRSYQSIVVQILSIFMSIVVLSIQTMSFQRFESQRINGRKLMWAMWLKKYREQELRDFANQEPMESTTLLETDGKTEVLNAAENTTETDTRESIPDDRLLTRQISTTPPLPPKNAHVTPPPTPLRGVTIVTPLEVPKMPAPPRPDSVPKNEDKNYGHESLIRPVSTDATGIGLNKSTSLKLPQRRYSQKGLDEDDPMGRAIGSLWWFLFIAPRIFSIAVFYEFYPGTLFAVLGVHYLIMLAHLFYLAKDYTAATFFINLWLGLVYIVAVIEYKIKFKYADKWLFAYYTFVMIQNTCFTTVWYFHAEWDGFWYYYIFYAIFGSMGLCIISTTVYQILLKPKKRRVYVT